MIKKRSSGSIIMLFKKNIFFFCVFFSFCFLLFGIADSIPNVALIGVLVLYAACLAELSKKFMDNIYIIFFYLVVFVFILSRPTISMLRGDNWWYFPLESINWSLICVFLSLLFLMIGNITSKYIKNSNRTTNSVFTKVNDFVIDNRLNIYPVLLTLLVLSFVASLWVEIDKLVFMHGREYQLYYIEYVSSLPSFVHYLSSLFFPFLILFLILKPQKKYCYFLLILFVILQAPMFIIGERGSLIKALIFSLLYFINITDKYKMKSYLNVKNIFITILVSFAGIVFLGSYNYIRSNESIKTYNPFSLFVDFFYKQGVSYDTINKGYVYRNNLPNVSKKNYTFGPIIDTIKSNTLVRKIFNTSGFDGRNSVEMATESNYLSHALSYVALGDYYLDGHGVGSSYLIELYIDYGYVGIIIYSFLMGLFLSKFSFLIRKNVFFAVIALYSLRELYIVPRAEALSFLTFLFRMNFWFSIFIFIFIVLCVARKAIKNAKNIALVDYDITVIGGVEKVTEMLANKLSNKYNVCVISLNKSNKDVPYVFNKNVKLFFVNDKPGIRLRNVIKNTGNKLFNILKENNIGLILGMGHSASFVSLLTRRTNCVKVISCDHGALVNQLSDKKATLIRRFNYYFSTHTVVLTERSMNDYIKYFHANVNKVSVIYNWIPKSDISKYDSVKYNSKSNRIITIGRISSEKGFDMLVKVASHLQEITNIDWQWDIYGAGPLKDQISADIVKNKLDGKVILKGEDKNVKDLLGNYGIYVLTSYREGLPIVLLEAKVNKLPVVSFDVSTGPSEIIDDGINGYLIDCYDFEEMAEKINYLLVNNNIRKKFSENTSVNLKKFSEDHIARLWYKLIDNVLKVK